MKTKKEFMAWLKRTVLPTIRRTGQYTLGEEHDEVLASLNAAILNRRAELKRLAEQRRDATE